MPRRDRPRLELVVTPDAGDRVLADPETLGHRTRRPLRRAVFGDLMQGVVDHRFDRAWRQLRLAPTSSAILPTPSTPFAAHSNAFACVTARCGKLDERAICSRRVLSSSVSASGAAIVGTARRSR